ncbi:MAG TPA: hypothetical protein VNR66_10080 [Solirubrobacteraceae bacterium]|nr:hypothetical protein [Solirubrobacteraceae bacterium]
MARATRATCLALGAASWALTAHSVAAGLHGIGKMAIPVEVLHEPGPLDPDEWTETGSPQSAPSWAPGSPIARSSLP